MKTCSWTVGMMALPLTLVALQGVGAQPELGGDAPKGDHHPSKVHREGGREGLGVREGVGKDRPEGKDRREGGDRPVGKDRIEGRAEGQREGQRERQRDGQGEGRDAVRREGGGKEGLDRPALGLEGLARLEAIAGKPLTNEQKQQLATIDTARRAAMQTSAQAARTQYQEKAAAVMGFPAVEWNARLQAAQNRPKGDGANRDGAANREGRDGNAGGMAWFEAMAGKPLSEEQRQQLREATAQNGEKSEMAMREAMLPFRAQTAAVLGLTPAEFDARERAWQVKQSLSKNSGEEMARFEALNGQPLTEEQKAKLLDALFQRNLAAAEYQAAQMAFRRTSATALGLTPVEIEARMQKLAAARKGAPDGKADGK